MLGSDLRSDGPIVPSGPTLSDADVIDHLERARNAEKHRDIMAGNWRQYDYPSQSEAEFAWRSSSRATATTPNRYGGVRSTGAGPYRKGQRHYVQQVAINAIRRRSWRHQDAPDRFALSRSPISLSDEPFPVACLPSPIREYVEAIAEAQQSDPAYMGTAILPVLAGAIGNTYRIKMNAAGWTEPVNIWAVLVGESSEGKSPAYRECARLLSDQEGVARARRQETEEAYKAAKLAHKEVMKRWRRERHGDEETPPAAPVKPVTQRYCCSDVTIEALAVRLQEHPRGLCLLNDEMSSWLGSFNQYNRGSGDVGKWLSLLQRRDPDYRPQGRRGGPVAVIVPLASVSMLGCATPGGLRMAINGKGHMENGLAHACWQFAETQAEDMACVQCRSESQRRCEGRHRQSVPRRAAPR